MYSIPFMYWIWQRFTRQNEPGNCPVEEEKDRMKYTIKKIGTLIITPKLFMEQYLN